jgi:hypothetical protein
MANLTNCAFFQGCEKRYTEARNQLPPHDWEPPAKVPKPPPLMAHQRRPGQMMGQHGGMSSQHHTQAAMAAFAGNHFATGNRTNPLQQKYAGMPQLQFGPRGGRGRPVGAYKPDGMKLPSGLSMSRQQSSPFNKMGGGFNSQQAAAAAMQAYNQHQSKSILSNLSSNSSVTIQVR